MTSSRSLPVKAAAPAFVAALAMAFLSACADDGNASPPPDNPDIRGVITSVTEGTGAVFGSVRIEGEIEDDTAYDKAVVRVERDTKVYRQSWEQWIEATYEELTVGQTVEAWFTGPVAESYPVQAKAARIVIMSDPVR